VVAVMLSGALLAVNNLGMVASWYPWPWPLAAPLGHGLLLCATVAWARRARLTWRDLGLVPDGWRGDVLQGVALGLFMAALVGALWLATRAIGWGSATAIPQPDHGLGFALKLLQLLLLTALYEELWFRGLLHVCWVGLLGPGRGVTLTALLFAAWHLALWAWTLDRVTLVPPLPFWFTYPAGLVLLFVAGLLFGQLRQVSGRLTGPIVAHWTIDVILVVLVGGGWL
jgi:membrane protease YdiL (CAAX protease family)